MQASPIRKLVPYAEAAKQKGITVYHLNIGQPDIRTPNEALKAVHEFHDNVIAYGHSAGLKELREALPAYYKGYGVDIDADDILITVGASEALQFAFTTIGEVGDEIIIPEPYYTNVASFAMSSMVNLVPVTSNIETGFALPDISEFEAKITDKTKAILLCSPNNPTGYIYSKEELLVILNLCKKHDIFLIVDEVYREFCYDGNSAVSILTFTEYADRVICIDSFSKRYSMCGARVGALISRNKDVIANALKLGQARLCPPEIEQNAALSALGTPQSYLDEVKAEYQKRRDCIVTGLQSIPGVTCLSPKGAFYLVAELPVDDAEQFAIFMLKDFNYQGETVMVAPAADFYVTKVLGKRQVRIAYVLNTNDLTRAVECLRAGLEAYNKR